MGKFRLYCNDFLMVLVFFGCDEKELGTSYTEQIVKIDLSEAREAKLSEFFQSVHYTLLDYSGEQPIGNAFKVVVTDEEYCVESRETAKVFVLISLVK